MEVNITRAGMMTTVQDLGRPGHRASGVPLSGAMDPLAFRLVNLLVGNPEDTAVLEFTMTGPELIFAKDALLATSGGDFGVPRWRPLFVRANEPVRFSAARSGCRGYLAVAGGFTVPRVLGSCSTYLRGNFGGWHGRPLRDGDVLKAPTSRRRAIGSWRISGFIPPLCSASPVLRVIRGAHAADFREALFSTEFEVSPKSDRMGLRLSGPALSRSGGGEIRSMTVTPGTIQVPPDGQPILLMADAQTLGGYPQIANVITVDIPMAAQLRPGDKVRFCEVSLEEAHELLLARERSLAVLREGLSDKFT